MPALFAGGGVVYGVAEDFAAVVLDFGTADAAGAEAGAGAGAGVDFAAGAGAGVAGAVVAVSAFLAPFS